MTFISFIFVLHQPSDHSHRSAWPRYPPSQRQGSQGAGYGLTLRLLKYFSLLSDDIRLEATEVSIPRVMKDPGKINNDSGWCQDEPPNYVGPGGGGGEVTIIYQ